MPDHTRTVAIVQSSYIPWKGYFDLINSVDEFILYDDVQYTRRDWRNRNRIKTKDGLHWLTIPVDVTGRYHAVVRDIRVSDRDWRRRHLATLHHAYARAPFFKAYGEVITELFLGAESSYLSEVNEHLLRGLCRILGIRTTIRRSDAYRLHGDRNGRLLSLCKQAGASRYVSGPSARAYLDEALFLNEGVAINYADYSSYREYPQLFPPFEHHVSIIDMLFNVGDAAPHYMKSFAGAVRVGDTE